MRADRQTGRLFAFTEAETQTEIFYEHFLVPFTMVPRNLVLNVYLVHQRWP